MIADGLEPGEKLLLICVADGCEELEKKLEADGFKQDMAPFLNECKTGNLPVILDFSAVNYISSVGLRVLMLAGRQVTAQKGRLALAALQPVVREVFEISRFNMVFALYDSVDAAAAALAA